MTHACMLGCVCITDVISGYGELVDFRKHSTEGDSEEGVQKKIERRGRDKADVSHTRQTNDDRVVLVHIRRHLI